MTLNDGSIQAVASFLVKLIFNLKHTAKKDAINSYTLILLAGYSCRINMFLHVNMEKL